jgi:hypothetical protein
MKRFDSVQFLDIKFAAVLRVAVFVLVGLCAQTVMAANVVQVGNCRGGSGPATISDQGTPA